MTKERMLAWFLVAFICTASEGQTRSKRLSLVQIENGTGFTVRFKGHREILYRGLRTPEKNLLFGQEAMEVNRVLLEGKKPRIEIEGSWNDPLLLATVYVEDRLGREICVNEEMLRRGVAVLNEKTVNPARLDAFRSAQQAGRFPEPQGMWQDHPLLLQTRDLVKRGSWDQAHDKLLLLLQLLEEEDRLLTSIAPLVRQWADAKLLQAELALRRGNREEWNLHLRRVMREESPYPEVTLSLASHLARWGLKSHALSFLSRFQEREDVAESELALAARMTYDLQDWALTDTLYSRLAPTRDLSAEEIHRWKQSRERNKKTENLLKLVSSYIEKEEWMEAWRALKDLRKTGGVVKEKIEALEQTFLLSLEQKISLLLSEGRVSDAKVLTSLPTMEGTMPAALREFSKKVDRFLLEWQQVLDIYTPEAFESYLGKDPPHELKELAMDKLQRTLAGREAYRKAFEQGTEQALREFVEAWSDTREAQRAQSFLERMNQPDIEEPETLYRDPKLIAERCIPGVLFLKFTRGNREGVGTAFVISDQGHALTAAHCVRDPESGDPYDTVQTIRPADPSKVRSSSYRPTFDYARVVKVDKDYDVALIKVPFREGMVPLTMGNSDTVNILDPVVVIGHPYGLDYTVTTGRINNILRKEMRDSRGRLTVFTLLQTDAAVNPGNSGGPLISAQGHVIGICSASYGDTRSEGLHFFVPINEAYNLLP